MSYDSTSKINIHPSSNLSYSTTYTATITTGVKDSGGNAMSSNYSWSFTTTAAPDATAPTGSVTINGGDSYTKSTTVTLNLSASDSTGMTGYYLSMNSSTPSASTLGWTTVTTTTSYSADVSYSLSSGDGNKTVYVWYKDTAGNISDAANDSIILDTTAPTITITSPTSDSTYTTTSSTVSLGGSASDNTSGVSSVKWSNSKGGSGTASGTANWSISGINLSVGDNTITVTATDNAGNSGTDTITVKYSSGPVPTPSPKATPSPTPTGTATPTATPTPTPTTTPEEEDLLEKYAPILYMHPDEQFHPTDVQKMLNNSKLYMKKFNFGGGGYTYIGGLIDKNKKKTLTLETLMEKYNDEKYYLKLKKTYKKDTSKKFPQFMVRNISMMERRYCSTGSFMFTMNGDA